MNYIILTQSQYDTIMNFRNRFKNILSENQVDIIPVKLIDGTYILPEKIIFDASYYNLPDIINFLKDLPKRQVLKSEIDKTQWHP